MTPSRARLVLGVAPGASPAQVEAAYRARAWAAHPDRGGAPAAFTDLADARRALLSAGPGAHRPPAPVRVVPDRDPLRRLVRAALRRWSAGHRPAGRHLS